MEALSRLLEQGQFQPAMDMLVGLLGATILGIISIMILHTVHLLGQHTALYAKRAPISGWSKRFYPASAGLIIGLLLLMWLLSAWSHTHLHHRTFFY